MEHPREIGKNVYLFCIKSQKSDYFIIQPLCLLFGMEIEVERSDASTFCRLNFAQMLQLLFNFILLSTFIGVVANRILILKKTPLADEKWLYGFTQNKHFKLILSSVEIKMVCSAEFQTRGLHDQTFSLALHDTWSLKMGKQIIPEFASPERKKTKPA